MTLAPFLTLEQRAAYLEGKLYLFGSTPSDEALKRLGSVNFHYFLGYARNYRMLADRGLVPKDAVLDRVFRIIDADRALSLAVFGALRDLEWRLRAVFVDEHCAMFPPSACFLDPKHYAVMNPKAPELSAVVKRHIERSREPFLTDHFNAGNRIGELPVWAVVDTWSLGVLSRVICESAPTVDAGSATKTFIWRRMAVSLGVSAQTITGNLEAISVLRNLVAHHSRLWMRPTSPSPKIPKRYPGQLRRSVHPKSMYGVFLALAEMLGAESAGRDLMADVDSILSREPEFKRGITQPITR